MEIYTFTSVAGNNGVLRVKSERPVELVPGFHRILEEVPDCNTVHTFTLTGKIKEETVGGIHYEWYDVKDYTCTYDRVTSVVRRVDDNALTNSITFVALTENGTIDSVTAGEHPELFAEWQPGISYTVGNIRRYGDKLYKCLQAHTSQGGWEPDVAVSLWRGIADPAEEWPEWSQPIGAADAYQSGDKVSHAGKHWVSSADNNVWAPGVYGWTQESS